MKDWAKHHVKKIALVFLDEQTITQMCDTRTEEMHKWSDELLKANACAVGKLVFGGDLDSILTHMVDQYIAEKVNDYAGGCYWKTSTMKAAIKACREGLMKMKGVDAIQKQRKAPQEYGGRPYYVLSTMTQQIGWAFDLRLRETAFGCGRLVGCLNERALWESSRLAAMTSDDVEIQFEDGMLDKIEETRQHVNRIIVEHTADCMKEFIITYYTYYLVF